MCLSKNNSKGLKRQAMKWEKIFADHKRFLQNVHGIRRSVQGQDQQLRYWVRCPHAILKSKSKPQGKTFYTYQNGYFLKNTTNVTKDIITPVLIAGWDVNFSNAVENTGGSTWNYYMIQQLYSQIHCQMTGTGNLNRYLHASVDSSVFHDSNKVETTQAPMNRLIGKQTVMWIYTHWSIIQS